MDNIPKEAGHRHHHSHRSHHSHDKKEEDSQNPRIAGPNIAEGSVVNIFYADHITIYKGGLVATHPNGDHLTDLSGGKAGAAIVTQTTADIEEDNKITVKKAKAGLRTLLDWLHKINKVDNLIHKGSLGVIPEFIDDDLLEILDKFAVEGIKPWNATAFIGHITGLNKLIEKITFSSDGKKAEEEEEGAMNRIVKILGSLKDMIGPLKMA